MSLGPALIARQGGLKPSSNYILRDDVLTADLLARVPSVALNAVNPSDAGSEALNTILSSIHERSGLGAQDALNQVLDGLELKKRSLLGGSAGLGGMNDLKAQLNGVEATDLFARDPRRGGHQNMKTIFGGIFGKRNLGAQNALLQILEDAGISSDVAARDSDGPGFEKILADFFTREEDLSRRSGGRGGHRNMVKLIGREKPDMRAQQTSSSLEEEVAALLALGGRNGLGAQADLTQLFAELGLNEQDLLFDDEGVAPAVKRSIGSLMWNLFGPLGGKGRNRQDRRGLDATTLD